MTFSALHLILRGKSDTCGRNSLFFAAHLILRENWTSADVMTGGIKVIKVIFFLVAQKLMKPIIAKKLR